MNNKHNKKKNSYLNYLSDVQMCHKSGLLFRIVHATHVMCETLSIWSFYKFIISIDISPVY